MDTTEYQKQYREKNKEKLKQWRLKNKEKIKEYNEKNKEKINESKMKYKKTEKGKKSLRISRWKHYGIIFHDFDLLYEMYLQTTHCDNCNCLLTYDRYTTTTTKCVDHDHSITDDENVRNILCHCCNSKRR
tara:strand:- start:59 stop:451 length:393 start_codon:yes stop_codon:yes gene_type:complete